MKDENGFATEARICVDHLLNHIRRTLQTHPRRGTPSGSAQTCVSLFQSMGKVRVESLDIFAVFGFQTEKLHQRPEDLFVQSPLRIVGYEQS
jgi:hypothetical protein